MAGDVVGTVSALWRFPCKSMGGEQVAHLEVRTGGVVGDRAYALVDCQTGRVVSAKSTRLFGRMLDCRAAFVAEPAAGEALPPLRIDLWDGTSLRSDGPSCDGRLSGCFGREVRLVRASPGTEGFAPLDDHEFEGRLGAPFLARLGAPPSWAAQGFQDVFALSLLTEASLRHLGSRQPQSVFDVRRFRMNVVLDTSVEGLVENAWVGRTLLAGSGLRLRVAMADARCALTTLAQGRLPSDPGVLRTIARENTLVSPALGRQACLGVYAAVEAGGALGVGDAVCEVS